MVARAAHQRACLARAGSVWLLLLLHAVPPSCARSRELPAENARAARAWPEPTEGLPGVRVGAPSPLTPLTGPTLTPVAGGGYWDADLGVPLLVPSGAGANGSLATWLLLGDVAAAGGAAVQRTPNVAGQLRPSLAVAWRVDGDGRPRASFPLLAESTVPAGAFALPAARACVRTPTNADRPPDDEGACDATAAQPAVFLFMMNVSAWRDGAAGNVSANGLLACGRADPRTGALAFEPAAAWAAPLDAPLVNAAPVYDARYDPAYVYVFASGRYRASPVYLARVPAFAGAVRNASAFEWWCGGCRREAADCAPAVHWCAATSAATPVLADVRVGELSALWDAAVRRFVLCFFDFAPDSPGMVCRTAAQPWGGSGNGSGVAWSPPSTVVTWQDARFPSGACCPYGGYLLPRNGGLGRAGAAAVALRAVVSLWVPYRAFVMDVEVPLL